MNLNQSAHGDRVRAHHDEDADQQKVVAAITKTKKF